MQSFVVLFFHFTYNFCILIFHIEFHLEQEQEVLRSVMDLIETEINMQKSLTEHSESNILPKQLKKRNRKWKDNIHKYENLWKENGSGIFDACTAFTAMNVSFCSKCHNQMFHIIRCNTCNQDYCGDCDNIFHFKAPFHSRTLLKELESIPLKPIEFISEGKKKERSIAHNFSNACFILTYFNNGENLY